MPTTTQLRVFDVLGKEISVSQQKLGSSIVLERGNLPAGIYFLKIERDSLAGQSPMIKIVAQ